MIVALSNPSLLAFLAAVQAHRDTGATLMAASGMDPCELNMAVGVAQERGFVKGTGEVWPSLALTVEGKAWVAAELEGLAPLFRECA